MWLYHEVRSLKDTDEMANIVDCDQTAPLGAVEQSDVCLHCLPRPICRKTYVHDSRLKRDCPTKGRHEKEFIMI